jgi:hypothetical protein
MRGHRKCQCEKTRIQGSFALYLKQKLFSFQRTFGHHNKDEGDVDEGELHRAVLELLGDASSKCETALRHIPTDTGVLQTFVRIQETRAEYHCFWYSTHADNSTSPQPEKLYGLFRMKMTAGWVLRVCTEEGLKSCLYSALSR